MTLQQLAYFLAVARTRHFTRAAAEVRVAQPSLSKQIHALEKELGAELFSRARGNVTLTPAGEALVQRIQEERRLMYVGITRAQRSLHLTWCKKRRRAREDVMREPSRFIEEMGLAEVKIAEDPATRALSPKERLGMLKALLNKP